MSEKEWAGRLKEGLRAGIRRSRKKWFHFRYARWLRRVSPDIQSSPKRIESFSIQPKFSIVLPTFNSNLEYLNVLIGSIQAQTYRKFEFCIADDGSSRPALREYLARTMKADRRIRVILGQENRGIAENTNRALAMATGDYLTFCDHDDFIEPFALEMFAAYINRFPDCDLFYSDEDMMDERGKRHSPRLQPDWNPDMFTSHMYFMHMTCVRKGLADQVGPMDPRFDGAQDHDFFLRCTEKAKEIIHVPHILYSWRVVSDSLASDPTAKLYAYKSGHLALEEALRRRGEEAVVVKGQGAGLGVYRVKRKVPAADAATHILAGNPMEAFWAAKSIRDNSDRPVEIIFVGEDADREQVSVWAESLGVAVLYLENGAIRAKKYNEGAKAASNGFLVFSPGNIEILDSDYPSGILEHLQRLEIGAVGCKILYPDGTFYHTGLILGVNGIAGYAHRGLPEGPGHWRYAILIRNYSAVSWDFLGVRRSLFEGVGGFDETLAFYQDVDFCLRLKKAGYRNLYTPYVAAVSKRKAHSHFEFRNRTVEPVLFKRYGPMITHDPDYHLMHTRVWENFDLDWEALLEAKS